MRGTVTPTVREAIPYRILLCCLFLLSAVLLPPSLADREGFVLTDEQRRERIRAAGLDPGQIVDPLTISAEMERRAQEVAGTGSQQEKLVRLQRLLFDQDQYRFDYEVRKTLTAEEAFQQKRGNCVSFTNLFIALARSLDIDAHAALAFGVPDKEQVGELVLISSHLVATARDRQGRTLYDFQLNRTGMLIGFQPIDDLYLTAIYLNNRGVENLLENRLDEARKYLEDAVRLTPDFVDAYSNLAVVYRRQGEMDLALDTYLLALRVDSDNPSLLNNLLVHYGMLVGENKRTVEEGQSGTTPRVEQLLSQGDQELTLGRVKPALEYYLDATRLAPDHAPAHVAAARALLVNGRVRKAVKSLHRALEANPEDGDALRLLAGLDRLAQH